MVTIHVIHGYLHVTIEKNKVADLLVLNGNPLENIMELTNIEVVIKSGKIVN